MQDISLTKHFKLREFTESATAVRHRIVNEPGPEAIENLRRLCEGCLEPLREALKLPVVITSGYRCKTLNNLIAHSSERSQHMLGQAADFYVAQGPVSGSKFQVPGSKPVSGLNFGRACSRSVESEQVPLFSRLIAAFKFNFVDSCRDSAYFKQVWSALAAPRVQGSGESRRELLIKAFRLILTSPEIDYDQLILYPTFIHVSYVSKERNRHGILKALGNGKLGYGRCKLANALTIE